MICDINLRPLEYLTDEMKNYLNEFKEYIINEDYEGIKKMIIKMKILKSYHYNSFEKTFKKLHRFHDLFLMKNFKEIIENNNIKPLQCITNNSTDKFYEFRVMKF